uniref:Gfo/Idh/MocA family protein n=1 Tax=Daejeonella sp. TaxID=2805397 RepID=UPI003982DF09
SSLHSQRRVDQISIIYSRNEENAKRFARDYQIPNYATDLWDVVSHPDTEVVLIALPNHLHEEAVKACVAAKKHVICTKPLGRTTAEAKRMLDMVEEAGIFGGYLEDLCYTPKFLKSLSSVQEGSLGRILWTRSREAHPGPHSDWFWDKEKSGGGAIIDLACHCVEIGRNFIGKNIRPVEVMCWADTQVHPIEAEDHALGWVKYADGAISQFEVSWTFRGGMDLRDEVVGTEGSIWINNFLRTGFEMFSTGKGGYVAEKAEVNQGWLFPVGDEAHELGYTNMFTDMFEAIEQKRQPMETFYDGYIVNTILDAALKSARTKQWEPVQIEDWRGDETTKSGQVLIPYDKENWLVKEEVLPNGDVAYILKHKKTGIITRKSKLN